jgi:hypothetical protein
MSSDIIFNLLANLVTHDFRDGAILNHRILNVPLQRVADSLSRAPLERLGQQEDRVGGEHEDEPG